MDNLFNRSKKRRWLYENQRGQTRVKVASVSSKRDVDIVIFIYDIGKYAFATQIAELKFTDLLKVKDLIRDAELFVKDMMKP